MRKSSRLGRGRRRELHAICSTRPMSRSSQLTALYLPLPLLSARRTNFLLTTSLDGHLKFWKKQNEGIEFVKHYRTHLSPIVGVAVDEEGKNAASIGEDVGGKTVEGLEVKGSVKVFEVENFGEL